MHVDWNFPLALLKVKTITLFVICIACAGELSAASFDCSKASNKVERTICSVASISALDEKLAVAYKKAGSSYKQSQRDWLKKRNKCGADANCLFIEYTARIKFLTDATSNPPTLTTRLVTSNLADCALNVFHNCYGTYTWDTGEKYVGEWQNRMRVGKGVFTYKNGNKYTGSWQNNVPDGQGSLSEPDGKVYVGQWIDGQYQQPKTDTADARTGNTFETITKTNKAEEAEKARLAAEAEEKKKLLAVKGEKFAISISQVDKAKWVLMDATVCSVVSEFALYQHKIGKIEYSENDIKVAEAIFAKGQRWYNTFTKNVGEGTWRHNAYLDRKYSDIKTCESTGSAYYSCWDRCISPMKR